MRFKRFLLFLLVPFFLSVFMFFTSKEVSAVSITNGIYSTAIYTKNFESQKTTYSLGPLNTGSFYVFNENNPTGIWDYTQALSFANPYTDKTGTGYVSSLYFTMHSTNGNFLNDQITSLLASINLGFEGLSEDLPYCSNSFEVRVQDSSTVQFLLRGSCPYGSYPEGTVFSQVESLVDYSPDSIFWCANDNPSRQCASNVGVTVYNIDYYFGVITSQEDSYNQTIINQNQTIINQNQNFYDHEYQATDNISNQSSSDIQGTENQKTTDLITALGSLVGAFTSIQPASDCNIQLDFPSYAGGSQIVNPCQHKEKAPQIVLIGSSVFLVLFALKYWNAMAIKIYKVIRSFIDGTDDTEGEE